MHPPRPLDKDFAAIRDSLSVPARFPEEVLAEAGEAAARGLADLSSRVDARGLPFVTIDPPESRDLDQAYFAARDGDGYRVYYAIADVSHFVPRGSLTEQEAWKRGVTLYSPDLRTPLYPPVLCEGAASLLPDVERPCVLFTLQLANDGVHELISVRRAIIRSRAKLGYPAVGAHLKAERQAPGSGTLQGQPYSAALSLLEEIGRKRQRLEVARGGVSLPIKTQHVQRSASALSGYSLALEDPEDVEGWNAQISLMTGMAAAALMRSRGVGLLRVLDAPRPDKLSALRLAAAALQISWMPGYTYADFIRGLDPKSPVHTAVMHHATSVMAGARYEAFSGEAPEDCAHAAIAAYYAHVTAPLRRLADRYALDLLVALSSGEKPTPELLEALHEMPAIMQASDRRARNLESAIVDFAEAHMLTDQVGERFPSHIIRLRSDKVTVQLLHPPVRAEIPIAAFGASEGERSEDGSRLSVGERLLSLGEALTVELLSADPKKRSVSFAPVLAPLPPLPPVLAE
jgi:exoribonuclease R